MSKLLNAAIEVETDIKRRDPKFGRVKRKFGATFKSGQKNGKINSAKKGIKSIRQGEMCSTCGKYHKGECLTGSERCFNCGKGSHFASECLSKGEKEDKSTSLGMESKPKTNA